MKKYVRGALTLEAIDNFFATLEWQETPEESREYEELGPIIPERLKLIQSLHEDDTTPPAAPAPAEAPAPAAPTAAPAAATPQPQQGAADGADEMEKKGYDAGWHQVHRGGSGTPTNNDPNYVKGFKEGFEQGGHAQTVRDHMRGHPTDKSKPAGHNPEGSRKASLAILAKHYHTIGQSPLVIGAAKRARLGHEGGAYEVLGDWGSRQVKGGQHTTLERNIANFYDNVQGDENAQGMRPSEFPKFLTSSAATYAHSVGKVQRKQQGASSGTGVQHGAEPKPEEPQQAAAPPPEGSPPPGGKKPAPKSQVTGKPHQASRKPRGVAATGMSKDPDAQSPIETAPAREPEGLQPSERSEIHQAMHDIAENHPEFESKPGEFDRRAFLKHYLSGEHENPASILRAMGHDPNGPARVMPRLILQGINSRGKKVAPGFLEHARNHPVIAGYNPKEESIQTFVARLYGLSLDESKGWLNEEAAYDLFGRWLIKAVNGRK